MFPELERLKKSFGTPEARRIPELIDEAAREPFPDPAALIRFHEILMFFLAYPHAPAVRAKAEDTLRRFPEFVTSLRTPGGDLSAFDKPEVSGIAGSCFSALFSFGTVLRLTQLHPAELDIDWDWYEDASPLGRILPRFLPLFEEDAYVEAGVPYRVWLESAVPPGKGTLAWLLERFAALDLPFEQKAELYDSLRLIVKWDLAGSAASRTFSRLPAPDIFYHDEPLIHRKQVSLDSELAAPPLPAVLLPRAEGKAFIDLALTASAVRDRELHGFTFGDPASVWKADAGRGVEIYCNGVLPRFRLPLRAYHSGVLFKNGVPIGYFEGLSLFERMELGFNLYYTFRDGETAWLLARLLRLCHQLLGVAAISIDPYQIGWNNEEAIESGAFWFYRKLGFRPVQPSRSEIAAREERKLLAESSYRTPARTLRKLAESPMIYEATIERRGDWDSFRVRNLGLAVQRRMAAENGGDSSKMRRAAASAVMRALGAKPEDTRRRGFENLALPLSLIPDLPNWSAAEKRALLQIIRAKDGPRESRYLRLMRRHARLRTALLALAMA